MKKKFFLFRWIDALFNGIKSLANKFIRPSVELVENLSELVESPTVPFITALIPGHWDDWLVVKAKTVLPEVLKILRVSDECLKLENTDEIITCAVKNLKLYTDEGKAVAYHNIAAMLSVYLSDKKITWREALHLAEEIYQERKAIREGVS